MKTEPPEVVALVAFVSSNVPCGDKWYDRWFSEHPDYNSPAQWQRGMSCWEWFVYYLRDKLAVLDIDWYMNTKTYIPWAALWGSGENVKINLNFEFANASWNFEEGGFQYNFEELYNSYPPRYFDIAQMTLINVVEG
jgi:hypothetical protein